MTKPTYKTGVLKVLDQSDQRAVADVAQPVNSHDARLSRVLDYQASSLEKDDPLAANLGSINSGLMRIALWIDQTIEQTMESGPPSVERLNQLLPAIETQLRLTRQVDRFAHIELRANEARKPKLKDNPLNSLNLDVPSDPGSGQSEDSEV